MVPSPADRTGLIAPLRPSASVRFPPLQARSLSGRNLQLPDGFEGDPSAVLVGFEPWHQALIDSWLPALEAISARRPGLRVYEVVPIERRLLPARPIIDGGMRGGIPDPAVRAQTLTAFTELGAFVADLGLPDTRDSALCLVAPNGVLRWLARGGCKPALAADLANAVRAP